ncbi:MAG: arylamine N-acetyltransferase family protein [Actinomycetota bacterium]
MNNVQSYLKRIGLDELPQDSCERLDAIHLAHVSSIPFENLDIHLGRPIRTDPESVYRKLVIEKRGGYCFEHNTLLATVLEEFGYAVRRFGARVGVRPVSELRRTHLVLGVTANGREHLCDVGFGVGGPLLPIPLDDDQAHAQFTQTLRLTDTDGVRTLQLLDRETWMDQYHFTRSNPKKS